MLERREAFGSTARLAALCLCLCLPLTACGKPPAERLDQTLQAAASWAATAEWIGETWARGEVPARFAERSLEMAGETLADQLEQLPDLPSAARPALGEHLRRLRAAVRQARTAVASGDPRGMASPAAQIAAEERALRALRTAPDGS
jgi:hypothetical protein